MVFMSGNNRNSNLSGCLFVIAAAVLWGTTGTSQALAPAASTPQEIGALRLLVGGVLLAGYSLARNRKSFKGVSVVQGVAGGIFVAAYQLCFFWGVSLTGVAVGTMVGIGSAPVFAGILDSLLFRRQPSARWYLSTGLALAGCLFLTLSESIEIHIIGIILSAGAGLSYALYAICMKKMLASATAETVAATIFCFGALFLFPFLAGADLSWVLLPNGLLVTIHLGLFATAVSYVFFCKGLGRISVPTAVTLSLAEPLTAGLLGVLVIGERLSAAGWLGLSLILSGLVILARPVSKSVLSKVQDKEHG